MYTTKTIYTGETVHNPIPIVLYSMPTSASVLPMQSRRSCGLCRWVRPSRPHPAPLPPIITCGPDVRMGGAANNVTAGPFYMDRSSRIQSPIYRGGGHCPIILTNIAVRVRVSTVIENTSWSEVILTSFQGYMSTSSVRVLKKYGILMLR